MQGSAYGKSKQQIDQSLSDRRYNLAHARHVDITDFEASAIEQLLAGETCTH